MNPKDWKSIDLEYGKDFLPIKVPPYCDVLKMRYVPALPEPKEQIENALSNPLGTWPIEDIIASCKRQPCSLILDHNPCHNFALKVAPKVRVDFSINVTINGDGKLTGIFTGDLEKAHLKAVKKLKEYSLIPCHHEYDIVLTQDGKVAVNHYQAAKAAYGTIPTIRKGGIVILAADNGDEEPIGKDDYKEVLKVLKEKGRGKFTEFIKTDSWQFIPDQW